MHRSVIYFLICCVLGKSTSYGASVVVDSVGGHHVAVRKVVPEGSQVSLQCRVPVNSQLSRMMDLIEPSPLSNPVVWLRFDMKDPSNQEVISHGDTLLIDTNPRLRLAFQEDTRTSTLIIDRAEVQDGGIFQCQVFVRDEVVPSSPIEVVIIEARSTTSGTPSQQTITSAHYYSCLLLLFMTLQVMRYSVLFS
ncbi:uncharacterized protein LOC130700085 [Daphnia carinata]|uniref:uncharacterized protein LOC130700085 n=1 Tax=Daphnia carinata TaxID=120202 RepID=UPI00257ABB3B|nr:uncharacterized protein LOC130700085 [Daphnia carinata]